MELSKGYGFKRVEADTLAKNKAMRRIAEENGFELEDIAMYALIV